MREIFADCRTKTGEAPKGRGKGERSLDTAQCRRRTGRDDLEEGCVRKLLDRSASVGSSGIFVVSLVCQNVELAGRWTGPMKREVHRELGYRPPATETVGQMDHAPVMHQSRSGPRGRGRFAAAMGIMSRLI